MSAPPQAGGPIIRFCDLGFSYEDGTPVLKGVTCNIQAGEKVAVVGSSGGGKSTLIKLLLGFYPVPDGTIYLYGADLNTWQLAAAPASWPFLRKTPTCSRSASRRTSPAAIRRRWPGTHLAAPRSRGSRAANIHDYIQSRPEGYATPAGERGARLSGGQRQRIALARAVVKGAPILLMDEPTSALDTESEALVQEALDRITLGHTSIVIAHRLSTIQNADRVLVLDDGRIVEEGTRTRPCWRVAACIGSCTRNSSAWTQPGSHMSEEQANMRSRGLGGATLWRLFDFLRPRRGQYFGAMLVMAAVGAGERLFTGYIVKLFGDAISGKDLGLLIKSVAYWGLYALGMLIVTPIFYYLWRASIVRGMANLRQAVFSHLQRLPLGYYEGRHSGEAIAILTNDVAVAEGAFQDNILALVQSSIGGIAAAIFMLLLKWDLALWSSPAGSCPWRSMRWPPGLCEPWAKRRRPAWPGSANGWPTCWPDTRWCAPSA